jgi:hypothetical protein
MQLPPKIRVRVPPTVESTLDYGNFRWFCGLAFLLSRTGQTYRDLGLAREYARSARMYFKRLTKEMT